MLVTGHGAHPASCRVSFACKSEWGGRGCLAPRPAPPVKFHLALRSALRRCLRRGRRQVSVEKLFGQAIFVQLNKDDLSDLTCQRKEFRHWRESIHVDQVILDSCGDVVVQRFVVNSYIVALLFRNLFSPVLQHAVVAAQGDGSLQNKLRLAVCLLVIAPLCNTGRRHAPALSLARSGEQWQNLRSRPSIR